MKLRKFLLAGALLVASLFSVNSVMAEAPTTTDNVKVNLKFQPLQSIVVRSATKEVDLVYATQADYSNGKSKTVYDHLEIFSTGGFVVTVEAESNFTNTKTGALTIPASHVKVSATNGTDNSNDYGKGLPEVTLSTSAQNFIASETGGTGLKFNVLYDNTTDGKSNNYINKYIHPDEGATVYTAIVTYTIATN